MLTKETLAVFSDTLRDRYVNHEITADEFASLSEDIKLASRYVS
jgi:hypothetical protein